MTRTLRGSLLIALTLVVTWATSSEACHRRRRACAPVTYCQSGYWATRAHRATTVPGAATAWLAGVTTTAGMSAARPAIPAGTATASRQPGYGQPGTGYDFGRPGYNPGGLGGPASGIGVRPGLGAGGFGPGR